jgi:hypothetical protein
MPKTSAGLNNSRANAATAHNYEEATSQVNTKYFIAENWGSFVEQRAATLCSRCQAFSQRLPQIAAKLFLKRSENCGELRATLESLDVSARAGCPLCSMLAMVMAHYLPKDCASTEVVSFDCWKPRQDIYLRSKISGSARKVLKIEPSRLFDTGK